MAGASFGAFFFGFGYLLYLKGLRIVLHDSETQRKKLDKIWQIVVAEESQDLYELQKQWSLVMSTIINTTMQAETQQGANMEGHPASIAELFDDADKAQPILLQKVHLWATKCRGVVVNSGVKPASRALQKAHLIYAGEKSGT